LSGEVRSFQVIEAYDRQVILMDLAVANTGVGEFSRLLMALSLGPDLPELSLSAVNGAQAPLSRGERRVWPVAMGAPLDADIGNRTLTLRIREAER
jgi:hypothetical protein